MGLKKRNTFLYSKFLNGILTQEDDAVCDVKGMRPEAVYRGGLEHSASPCPVSPQVTNLNQCASLTCMSKYLVKEGSHRILNKRI
jgi:hypothetical protein